MEKLLIKAHIFNVYSWEKKTGRYFERPMKSGGFKLMDLESFLLLNTESRRSHSGFTNMCLVEFFCFYPLKEKNALAFCQPQMLKQQ